MTLALHVCQRDLRRLYRQVDVDAFVAARAATSPATVAPATREWTLVPRCLGQRMLAQSAHN